ncbi:uncharacterized protein ACNLHF_021689 isoform 2-T2 [Anomaloglossus baeobatrachus]
MELNSGEDAVINCSVKGYSIKGVHVRKRFKKKLFIKDKCPSNKAGDKNYNGRLSCSGDTSHFSITLKNVTVDDTDIYFCDTETVGHTEICGTGTLLIVHPPIENVIYENKDTVTEGKEQACRKDQFAPIPYIIAILIMFVLCVAFSIYMKLKKSKEKQNLNHNTYVDMTQTIRRNTMGNSFIYSRSEN